jgi:hypothetical protein
MMPFPDWLGKGSGRGRSPRSNIKQAEHWPESLVGSPGIDCSTRGRRYVFSIARPQIPHLSCVLHSIAPYIPRIFHARHQALIPRGTLQGRKSQPGRGPPIAENNGTGACRLHLCLRPLLHAGLRYFGASTAAQPSAGLLSTLLSRTRHWCEPFG